MAGRFRLVRRRAVPLGRLGGLLQPCRPGITHTDFCLSAFRIHPKMKQTNVLEDCVRASLDRYFDDLGDAEPHDMWDMVMRCVERPLLEAAMARAAGNQTRASAILGMTRNTLRKKLLAHNIPA